MRYPTLTRASLINVAAEFLESGSRRLGPETSWEGHGSDMDLSILDDMSARLMAEIERADAGGRDEVEAHGAVIVHRILEGFPLPVLDDPAFWRYMAAGHCWDFVHWRQQGAFESHDPNRYLKYLDAVQASESVLPRMFLRAQIAQFGDDYSLATAVPAAADLWRSHILRVGTGSAPTVARALLREQAEHRMSTDDLRSVARRLNRVSSNVVLCLYDESDAAELLTELRADLVEAP